MERMTPFFTVFLAGSLLLTTAIGLLLAVTRLREKRLKKRGGCREKVRFHGEEIKCPACELREWKLQQECGKSCGKENPPQEAS